MKVEDGLKELLKAQKIKPKSKQSKKQKEYRVNHQSVQTGVEIVNKK